MTRDLPAVNPWTPPSRMPGTPRPEERGCAMRRWCAASSPTPRRPSPCSGR
ncbi:hypothetical protein QJS66_14855 [Kocuria rhizophila]|nr:hypothetical protein QJS66_14855 [Kocuria rhizophila]